MRIISNLIVMGLATVIVAALAGGGAAAGQTPPRAVAADRVEPGGVARFTVGRAVVTALADGTSRRELARFQSISPEEAARRLRAAGDEPPEDGWYNVFLVDVGGRRVLVDTGAGRSAERPGGGRLPQALGAGGVDPASVDAVVLSHSHADHVGGLLDENGRARFPTATLHLHAAERDFWLSGEEAATARRILAAYQGRVRPFSARTVLAPGLAVESVVGHTPGHSVVRLSSTGRTVLFVGDLIHSVVLQAPTPDVTLTFDADPAAARAARQAFLKREVRPGVLFAGPHLPTPGVGRFLPVGTGFRYAPAAPDPNGVGSIARSPERR